MQIKVLSWSDKIGALSEKALGSHHGRQILRRHHALFTDEYRSLVSPRYALNDVLQIERLLQSQADQVDLIAPYANQANYRLHFYSLRERYLDEFIPVFENLGLRIIDQVQFNLILDGNPASIKSFTVKPAKNPIQPLKTLKSKLLDIVRAVMAGRVENDALNKLCVYAGLRWQEIDVLRAYRNYFLQLGHKITRASIHHAVVNNPEAALALFDYFDARFKPNPAWQDLLIREENALFPLRMQLLSMIDRVSDINDDRILRTLFNLIDATVRSNYHNRRFSDDFFIAFKINSIGVIDMPSPRPQHEIYVHANDMEGIHLRAGKISRGGIRWSDRPDDFRSEILGLMQTQVNKNALIIPTGAKGGFIVKQNGSTPDFKEAGKRAYIRLIRGLLDLTDNYRGADIVAPEGLVLYDDPDPYLVVAADKGTAKFSDIANRVAEENGFWLGDAFASGGSHGYDHKALGITARGAWECVKRHFRELNKDIQSESFTVIGVGSMDGDVFGNGMLQSRHIRLLAAFSGQHIFLDPAPFDDALAFAERKRLFDLPGSTWDDYDRKLICSGGGVYLRSAKDIPVSPELKKWLGIRYKSIDGESLIRYLLTAPVELLWLGGIGTYVKAGSEKHEDVGDRANDNVRVDACELSANVVGEGANLGFTQKARIEFALKGGRINTDAIDNSAGVDTSDHEVNLKILLNLLHKQNLISGYHVLFAEMTEKVCNLVLTDNVAQSLCLSLEQLRCAESSAGYLHVADRLEAAGYLDRTVDAFPHAKEILSREGHSISRPEFADLIAAGKRYLTQQILKHRSELQSACFDVYLFDYFPERLVETFGQFLRNHPLADEIKATVISNRIINQAGCEFLTLLGGNDDSSCSELIACYLAFDRIFRFNELRDTLTTGALRVDIFKQYEMLVEIERVLWKLCRWSLRQRQLIAPDETTVETYRRYLTSYLNFHSARPAPQQAERLATFQQDSFPVDLGQILIVAASQDMQSFPFLVQLATQTGHDFSDILSRLTDVEQFLRIKDIEASLGKIQRNDPWQDKLLDDLRADLQQFSGAIVAQLLAAGCQTSRDYFERPDREQAIENYRLLFQEVQSTVPYSLYAYLYLIRALGKLSEN